MKNLTYWELQSFCISGKNKLIGEGAIPKLGFLKSLITLIIFTSIIGCGPVPEETAHQKALKDSAAADSIMHLEASKIRSYELAKKKFTDSIKALKMAKEALKKDSLSDSLYAGFPSPLPLKNPQDTLSSPKKSKPDTSHRNHKVIRDSLGARKKIHRDSLRVKNSKPRDTNHKKVKIRLDTGG